MEAARSAARDVATTVAGDGSTRADSEIAGEGERIRRRLGKRFRERFGGARQTHQRLGRLAASDLCQRARLRGGRIVIAPASEVLFSAPEWKPDGWKEQGRFTLSPQTEQRSDRGKIWTHPVIANGKLYLRDQ